MSDSFFLDFCESMAMESSGKGGGMPIPRGPSTRGVGIVGNHYPDFTMALQMDDHSPQPGQHHDNRDVNIIPTNFGQDTTFGLSPMGPNSPSLWPPQTMDLDVDIKLEPEPLDDLLSVEDFLPSNFTSNDSVLLDDVSFDDLLMPEQFSSPTMDHPQSPHTMLAVHPDEVLAARSYPSNMPTSPYHHQSSSMGSTKVETVPQTIKAESNSLFSLLASSFPPQGGGWHDPLLTSSSLPGQQVPAQLGSIEECPSVVDQVQHIQQQQQQHLFQHTHSMSPQQQQATGSTSALQELLLRSPSAPLSPQHAPSPIPSPQESLMGQSVPRPTSLSAANPLLSARLSSSAPTRNFSLEQAWQRREPRQHLLSTGSLAEELDGSTSSLSTVGGILSPSGHDLSIDEGLDSEDESDNEHYDSESDNDSIVSEDTGSLSGSMSKKERYFWQYNVQAKGPKGQRVTINQQARDPYSLPSVMDPVFSPLCSIQGIKHSGKARRGDGNDLTPNPRKLVSIGRELDKLNKTINDMTPVSELPFNVRPKSRKEKNKLASRACRLKKKAQHEANKIKLYGLEQEHKSMLNIIDEARALIHHKIEPQGSTSNTTTTTITANTLHHHNQHHHHAAKSTHTQQPQGTDNGLLMQNMEKLCKMKSKFRIAGHTTDFVNKVIENCQNGNSTGGLEEVTKIFNNTNLATSPPSNMGGGGFSPH